MPFGSQGGVTVHFWSEGSALRPLSRGVLPRTKSDARSERQRGQSPSRDVYRRGEVSHREPTSGCPYPQREADLMAQAEPMIHGSLPNSTLPRLVVWRKGSHVRAVRPETQNANIFASCRSKGPYSPTLRPNSTFRYCAACSTRGSATSRPSTLATGMIPISEFSTQIVPAAVRPSGRRGP